MNAYTEHILRQIFKEREICPLLIMSGQVICKVTEGLKSTTETYKYQGETLLIIDRCCDEREIIEDYMW